MSRRAVRPENCVLLLAVPLDDAAFDADVANPCKDYARSVAAPYYSSKIPAGAGKQCYGAIARLLEETIANVTKGPKPENKVLVRTNVTLENFADLLRAPDTPYVFSLVAHHLMVDVSAGDVPDVAALLRQINTCRDSTLRYVRGRMADERAEWVRWAEGTGSVSSAPAAADVAAYLNHLLRPMREFYERGIDPKREIVMGIAAPPARLTRDLLEFSLPNEMEAAKVLELADGLCSVAEFVSAIPFDFEGVLDLSVCSSETISEVVRRCRRCCSVIHNQRPAIPFFKLSRYRQVIERLGSAPQPAPYEDVFADVTKELLE